MVYVLIYVIVSFLLDGFMSLYTNFSIDSISYFKTIYTIISIVMIYHLFSYDKKYLIIILILGMLFDMVYTNVILLNVIIFVLIYYVVKYLDYVMPNNIFTINIKTLIAIIIYHLVSFIVLNVVGYGSYGVGLLFKILTHSVIITVFYTSLSYLIFKKINVDKIR